MNISRYMTYPFPSLKRGAVVAVTKWIPSFPHSKHVESLAYITSSKYVYVKALLQVIYGKYSKEGRVEQ